MVKRRNEERARSAARRRSEPRWMLALALAVPVLAAAAAGATEEAPAQPEGWAYELAGDLMSPFCPGVTISECTSSAAKSLTMWLVVQEAAGRSRKDVEEELYARYGDQIRAAPRPEGFGLAAYVIPVVAFLGGGALLFVFLRRQTQSVSRAEPPSAPRRPLDPELARLVDEEIGR
jgi:cytochrome c-type biogenesis protein CcmH/NrfF